MTPFTLAEQAEDDLIGIAENLAEAAGETAGTLIFDRVYRAADLLAAFPEMGRERPDLDVGIRTFPTEDYLICYRIEESVVKIVRIVYQRQDISKLFGRRKSMRGGRSSTSIISAPNCITRNATMKKRLADIIPPAFARAVLDDADSTHAFPSEDEVFRVCMAARKRIRAGFEDVPEQLGEAVEIAIKRYSRDDFEPADSLFVEFHASLGQEPVLRDVDDWNRRCIDEACASLDRGEGSPAEEVFARLRARFGADHDR